MSEKISATEQWCDKSGAPQGADNSTHHIITGATGIQRCRYCKRPLAEIPTRTVPTIRRGLTFTYNGREYVIIGGGPGTPNADFGYEILTADYDNVADNFFRVQDIRDFLRRATVGGWDTLAETDEDEKPRDLTLDPIVQQHNANVARQQFTGRPGF